MDSSAVYQLIVGALAVSLHVVVPFGAFLIVVALVASFAQHGWFWSTAPLAPRWAVINPLNGLKQLASLTSLVELAKSVVKFAVLGGVLFVLVRRNLDAMVTLRVDDPSRALATVISLLGEFGLWGGGAIAIVGVVDYGFRFWQHEQKLRMTHKELQDEVKQSEGNPMIKSRIRSLQRERARKRMMADVPTADVVITNPTELAIAMVYRHGEMAAPKVVAKGAGVIAQRIREVARAHGVPLVENKPLTRALFGVVDVGGLIPSQFYRAVAEVLAYVYRLKEKAR
jgi:flagellar biosynthetic protein FlhB